MSRRILFGLLFTGLLLLLTGWFYFQQRSHPLTHQAYIWQRVWTADHADALIKSHSLFSQLRILALQFHRQEGWVKTRPALSLLKQDGRPIWFVVRLDGSSLQQSATSQFIHTILQHLQSWQAAGLNIAGVEIDHDSGNQQLSSYLTFIQALRAQLPPSLSLSMTALPSWLEEPTQLSRLLQVVDNSVLQVHAVQAANKTLFDQQLAKQWVNRYNRLTSHPFQVALPAYSMAIVGYDQQGAILESETALRAGLVHKELIIDPINVGQFLNEMRQHTPTHLSGIIWFRLPLSKDKRAWSLTTLATLIQQQPIRSKLTIQLQSPTEHSQDTDVKLYDIHVSNDGNIDTPFPYVVEIAAKNCIAGDGINGYRYQTDGKGQHFLRTKEGLLPVGKTLSLGWLRCSAANLIQGDSIVLP